MIRLPDVPLSAAALSQLESWQAEVNAIAQYVDRVEAAKQRFLQRNTMRNKTFATVRRALEQMCTGTRRCGYCEDSAADEVDHLWPKEFYPELVFAWRNYLYACGRCNRSKSHQSCGGPSSSFRWLRRARRTTSGRSTPSGFSGSMIMRFSERLGRNTSAPIELASRSTSLCVRGEHPGRRWRGTSKRFAVLHTRRCGRRCSDSIGGTRNS